MKRLTTERPQDNVQSTLNLFYVKDKETWIRGGGPAPEYRDVTLDDFMRRMIKEKHLDVKVPEDWKEFSAMMAEWLMDDPESETGMLALMYAAAWGFAEIRERLKRYEDTGAMPDVLEELLEGLTRIEKLGGWDLVDRWVKAVSEGRLVELPCKVGDTVYTKNHHGRIVDGRVVSIHQNWLAGKAGRWVVTAYYPEYNGTAESGLHTDFLPMSRYYGLEDFGTVVLLTAEEAEAAMKGEDHGEQV